MSCTINASTSAGLVMTSDLSGVLQLQNNGVNLPLLTVAPAFSAYQSSAQSISNNTATKVQFQTKEFDTNSNFDNTTNYRFTPTVAGYYQVNGLVTVAATGTYFSQAILYKNGSATKTASSVATASSYPAANITGLIYMNGSTDYLELYVFQFSGSTQNLSASTNNTCFSASLARSA